MAESKSKLGRPSACIGGSQSPLPAAFGLICNEKTSVGRTRKPLSNGRRREGHTEAWGGHCMASAVQSCSSQMKRVAVKSNRGIHKGPQTSGGTRYFPVLCALGKESSNSDQSFRTRASQL